MTEENKDLEAEEKPPFFKKWKGWYLLVLGNLVFLIILFYLFTNHYS